MTKGVAAPVGSEPNRASRDDAPRPGTMDSDTAEALAFGGNAAMIANASNASRNVGATMAENKRFTKKVILDRFRIAENTLRSWEAKGIISPPERDWRGWRWYSKQHLAQIEKHIAKLKRKVERSAKQPKQGGGA